MAASIKTIAELAGVSTATVSRVFSGKGYVRREVAQNVLQIAAQQGFEPKRYKRQVRAGYESVIGVIVPDICNTYYMDVIHGIESVVNEQDVQVLILNTDEDPRKEIRSLSTLKNIGVDGVIAVPVSDAEVYNANYLIEMNHNGIPVVLLDRDVKGADIDGVFMDNFNSGYQSTQTFIENGHKDIAIICGPATSTSSTARLNGYLAALKDHHLPVNREYILFSDFKFDLAYKLTMDLAAKKTPVTAIFACNSRMSRGCLMALAECGISVPGDMGFIACGRLDGNYDRISSVIYPTLSIGAECAKILLEKMQPGKRLKNGPKKRITFDMELVLRGSEVFPANRQGGEKVPMQDEIRHENA